MKEKTLNLPKVYRSTSKKFKKFDGRPKLSYSQYTSWKDPDYFNSYVLGYIFNIPQPSNFWATMGSYCGTLLQYRMDISKAEGKDRELLEEARDYLNVKDIETLQKADRMFPKEAVYEREIVLDRGEYVTQGFLDVNFNKDKKAFVIDVKTGNKNTKTGKNPEYYKSEKYGQVPLYARALEQEGEEIGYCGVVFLDRTYETERTHPGTTSTFEEPILHLSGDIIKVDIEYSKERAERVLKDMDRVAQEISSLKSTYDKMKSLTFEL